MRKLLPILLFISLSINAQHKAYQQTYDYINSMLTAKTPLNFKNAVWMTENAFYNDSLNIKALNHELNVLSKLTHIISKTELVVYENKDKHLISKHAALFKVITDSLELTSATFPIDAWIMASGYVTIDAIQNGLYMDTISSKQAVANCLVDLAQGYQHKYGKGNPDFVVKCCNTALQHHPSNVNAMLTKAEAQKYYIHSLMKVKNIKNPVELFSYPAIKEMYLEMESIYIKLHKLGYRRMPEDMYLHWIELLNKEPNKYINQGLNTHDSMN